MAIITIQIRGLNMTRRRHGDELDDPISEFEDGEGESNEIVAHFNTALQIHELPTESVFDVSIAEEEGPSFEVIGGISSTKLGGYAERGNEGEQPHQQQDEAARLTEQLRRDLVTQGSESVRTWLQALARQAAAHPNVRLELRIANSVAGGTLRTRLRILRDALDLKCELRPTIIPDEKRSLIAARAETAAPRVHFFAYGSLQRDGSILGLKLEMDRNELPTPSTDLQKKLDTLIRLPPDAAAEALGALIERESSVTAQYVAAELERAETVAQIDSVAARGARWAFGDSEAEEPKPDALPVDLALEWTDDDRPLLTAGSDSLNQRRTLDRDFGIFRRLASVISQPSSDESNETQSPSKRKRLNVAYPPREGTASCL